MRVILSSIVVGVLFIAVMPVGVNAGFAWDTQTVYDDSRVLEVSLVVDSNDYPHICFLSLITNFSAGIGLTGNLQYAHWNGTDWQIQTVDSNGDVGYDCSIALDSQDNPHIGYFDKTNLDLKYAYWNGTDWNIQVVDSHGDVGYDCSIAVDTRDTVHVCYYNRTKEVIYGLKYGFLKRNTSEWNVGVIEEDYGWDVSLAVKRNGWPCVTHFDFYRNKTMKYLYWSGSRWDFMVPEYTPENDTGRKSSLVLDKDDRPHICYLDNSNRNLKYTYWTGDDWIISTVDKNEVGYDCSLQLDNQGRPHICYEGINQSRDIRYAYWTGSNWDIHTVDMGRLSSLDLDSKDFSHISYVENNSCMYAYATLVITSPQPGEVWYQQSKKNLTWKMKNTNQPVKIELFKDDTAVLTIANHSNDTSYAWRLPENLAAGEYELRITSSTGMYASSLLRIKEQGNGFIVWIIGLSFALILLLLSFVYLRRRKK